MKLKALYVMKDVSCVQTEINNLETEPCLSFTNIVITFILRVYLCCLYHYHCILPCLFQFHSVYILYAKDQY